MRRATPAQHAALQMVCEDIALQLRWPNIDGELVLMGPDAWAQLFILSYDRAHGGDGTLMQAIDGHGFDGRGFDPVRRRKRSRLNIAEGSEVIEFALAFAIEHKVKLREKKQRRAA